MQFIAQFQLADIKRLWQNILYCMNYRNLILKNKKVTPRYMVLLFIFLVMVAFSGCENIAQPNSTPSPGSTPIITPTVSNSPSPTSTPDATNTAVSSEPVEKMAENYCLALKDHNYTAAYAYLDTTAINTTTGQKLTLPSFTKLAQDDDNSQGPISSYSAAAFPPLVVLTISRNSGPYHVHLQVKLEDSVWKITSLDRI